MRETSHSRTCDLGDEENEGNSKFKRVLLIGFQDQGNRGVSYLASTLLRSGYSVDICDFELDSRIIVDRVKSFDPAIVGFSLIFQFYITSFSSLIRELRDAGVRSHFTMGGHFPSLSPAE